MDFPREGVRLTPQNFQAVGEQIQQGLQAGKEYRLRLELYQRTRTLSQNALAHRWFSEISRYLIQRGRTDCSPEWVKQAMKYTYLGFEKTEFTDVVTGERACRETLRKTSRLKTGEMFDFMTRVQAWAMNIGCLLTVPENCEFAKLDREQNQ